MNLEHCDALISDMESSLNDISATYSEPNGELLEISASTKIKIKNFLENANSVLDYIAFYIFEKYSKNKLDEKTFISRSDYVSFFYSRKKEAFKKNMEQAYPNLQLTNPELYCIFEKYQPWCAPKWRSYLHKLVNQNKHKNLSIQTKTNDFDIAKIDIPGAIYVENSTNIFIGEISIDGISAKGISGMKEKFGHIGEFDYIRIFTFTDLDKPVIQTLDSILIGEQELINTLKNIKIQTT